MNGIRLIFLLLLSAAGSHAQDSVAFVRTNEISFAAGVNTNTPPNQFHGPQFGSHFLLNPVFVFHVYRHFTRNWALGFRIDRSTWNSYEDITYTDTITRTRREGRITYYLGQPAVTGTMIVRWRSSNDRVTLGGYVGFAGMYGRESVNNGLNGGGDYIIQGGGGLAVGVEGGFRQHLSDRLSIEVLASAQYAQLQSGYRQAIYVFAFPVTAGLSVALGETTGIRSRKLKQEYHRRLPGVVDEIERLKQQRESGIITPEEYERSRKKLEEKL